MKILPQPLPHRTGSLAPPPRPSPGSSQSEWGTRTILLSLVPPRARCVPVILPCVSVSCSAKENRIPARGFLHRQCCESQMRGIVGGKGVFETLE